MRSITILERYHEQELQDQGAGLRIGREVIEFLQTYTGTNPEEYTRESKVWRVYNPDGTEQSGHPIKSYSSSWGQLFRILTRHLRDEGPKKAAVPCTYSFGCTVVSLTRKGDEIEVHYTQQDSASTTITASLVLCADGASSRLRGQFLPGSTRETAGYVAVRGTAAFEKLSQSAKDIFDAAGFLVFNHNCTALAYLIPSNDASARSGSKLLNWAWFVNMSPEEIKDTLTTAGGIRHKYTLPKGQMRPEIVQRIKDLAKIEMIPEYSEVVTLTEKLFVQVITDSLLTDNLFMDDKVLFIGDAVSGSRPHIAAACSQCVYHAEMTRMYVDGEISSEEWRDKTLNFATELNNAGKELGALSQKEVHGQDAIDEKRTTFLPMQMRFYKWINDTAEADMLSPMKQNAEKQSNPLCAVDHPE